MTPFDPQLQVLPGPQRRLWTELKSVPKDFVLYGGTAVGLRLGHRTSMDFDFFSSTPFSPEGIIAHIPWLSDGALSYFADGDLPKLPDEVKHFLAQQAALVRSIPQIPRLSDQIAP